MTTNIVMNREEYVLSSSFEPDPKTGKLTAEIPLSSLPDTSRSGGFDPSVLKKPFSFDFCVTEEFYITLESFERIPGRFVPTLLRKYDNGASTRLQRTFEPVRGREDYNFVLKLELPSCSSLSQYSQVILRIYSPDRNSDRPTSMIVFHNLASKEGGEVSVTSLDPNFTKTISEWPRGRRA